MLNTDRIQTTHVGSLPRTPELLAANEAYQAGTISWEELVATMQQGVRDIVARQSEIGIDIVNDGEYGHTMSSSVDYGAWWNYSFSRLGGLSPSDEDRWDPNAGARRSSPGNIVLTSFADRRDRQRFAEAYADQSSGILTARKRVAQPKITRKTTTAATLSSENQNSNSPNCPTPMRLMAVKMIMKISASSHCGAMGQAETRIWAAAVASAAITMISCTHHSQPTAKPAAGLTARPA